MGVKTIPKEGCLVEVTWLDAVGYINANLADAKPAQCTTIGRLAAVNRQSLTLATSLFEDGTGDFTVIPRGMLVRVKKVSE
jgi:hypothetical protein